MAAVKRLESVRTSDVSEALRAACRRGSGDIRREAARIILQRRDRRGYGAAIDAYRLANARDRKVLYSLFADIAFGKAVPPAGEKLLAFWREHFPQHFE